MKTYDDPELQKLIADDRFKKLGRAPEMKKTAAFLYLWAPNGVTLDMARRMVMTNECKLLLSVGLWKKGGDGYVSADAIAPAYTPKAPVMAELEDAQAESHTHLEAARVEAEEEPEPDDDERDADEEDDEDEDDD